MVHKAMTNTREQIRKELRELIEEAPKVLSYKKGIGIFVMRDYQSWYSRALATVRQLLPDRLQEFEELYRAEKRKEINAASYSISDYLIGLSVTKSGKELNTKAIFEVKTLQQIAILRSAETRLDSILSDISSVLRAELFDDEISRCRELLRAKHCRAAGVMAGVILETHLLGVCSNHSLKLKKQNPTLSEYNQILKDANILDIPNWRWIQRLTDIRNLCAHAKEREPTEDEIKELIDGAEKVIKTVF